MKRWYVAILVIVILNAIGAWWVYDFQRRHHCEDCGMPPCTETLALHWPNAANGWVREDGVEEICLFDKATGQWRWYVIELIDQ